MKKFLLLLLFALFGLEHTGAFPIAAKQLAVSAPAEFNYAAKKAVEVLGKICKKEIPLTANGNIKLVKDPSLPAQGYSLQTTGDHLTISASDPQGAAYGVARLAQLLGYRYFFPAPEWEIIPESLPPRLTIAKICESPAYLSRRIWPSWGIWRDIRKETNNDENWKLFNFQGGINISCGHVYGRFIHHRKKIFAAHPEYYALSKGKRNSSKLCISNPALRQLFIDYKLEKLAKNPAEKCVSAEPSDGSGWCECENCLKLGSPSTRAVILANATASAVSAKYPGKKVGMYAYNLHSPAPDIDLHPNVIINIATSFIKGGHTVEELIKSWKARKADIGIREYYFANIAPGSGNGTNPVYMKNSLMRLHKHGARYITAESSDSWGSGGLGFYCGAQMMWDISRDPEELKKDFLKKAFPKSIKPMTVFYALIDGSPPRELSRDLIGRMYRALNEAGKIASGKEKQRIYALVCYTRFCELYFQLLNAENWQNYRTLMLFGASIRRTRMIHTYARFRSPRGLCPRNMLKKPLNIDWFKTPAPTLQELDKIVADGIKNNPLLDFEAKSFSNDLIVLDNPRGTAAVRAGNTRRAEYFYLWSNGKPFDITVTGGLIKHYRDRGNVILKLIQIGGASDTGEMETVVQYDRSVPPDGKPRKVRITPKYPGLHKLFVNDNGDMTNIKWPADIAVARPVEKEKTLPYNGTFYFYVPHGTKTLGFFAKTTRGFINDPSGKRVFNLAKRNGYYSFPVKPQQCGKVWKINSMNGTVKLLTVPSVLSLKSSKILIPKETKGK